MNFRVAHLAFLGLLACGDPDWHEETFLTVDVDGPTDIDVIAFMERDRAVVSSTQIVRVTSTPDGTVDPSTGVMAIFLAEPENEWEEAAVVDVSTEPNLTRIDGVAESFVSARPVCNAVGECWDGYCFEYADCPIRFRVHIEPREQSFTTELHLQWRSLMSEFDMDCGDCDRELTAIGR